LKNGASFKKKKGVQLAKKKTTRVKKKKTNVKQRRPTKLGRKKTTGKESFGRGGGKGPSPPTKRNGVIPEALVGKKKGDRHLAKNGKKTKLGR